ncbi:MAG: hypothetical protein JETCAE03_32970 [Ignavibacteriaceae bacterium]|jgi:putative FmdB family regulatory protein|nr:MAG: hypothetical protein JETCAE03_32970 [Ignavibacteriaceae bacterium]
MPTYDFKCENGHIFDLYLKKIYNETTDSIECPSCGAKSKRQFSKNKSGWVLIGQGWAKDGYGNKIEPKKET